MHPYYFFRVMLLLLLITVLVVTPTYISGEPDVTGTSTGGEWKDFWVIRLSMNLLGYMTIVIPGYFLIRYVRQTNYLDRAGKCFRF